MAAKKAPAKKMAAPKPAAKKTGSQVRSANAAENDMMKKKAEGRTNRTDVAGRGGFGETAASNMLFKNGNPYSSANLTANAAGLKAAKTAKDPKNSYREYEAAYIKSIGGAAKYAYETAPTQRNAARRRGMTEAAAKKKK